MNLQPLRSKHQIINYLAIDLLAWFGNEMPNQSQISFVEDLLTTVAIECKLDFSNQLTEREVSCLYLAARGKSAEETADILQIKSSTVNSHKKNLKKKLFSANMAEAVFNGMRFGYIKPKHLDRYFGFVVEKA